MEKTFYFDVPLAPTQWNLQWVLSQQGWGATEVVHHALLSEMNLFSDESLSVLEYKHLFASYCRQHAFAFVPDTYAVDELNVTLVTQKLADEVGEWIIKPSLLNNGKGIYIARDISQVADYFAQPQRMGGMHVLQKYIAQPALMEGKKYSLRQFAVITNQGKGYLYRQGYLNICQQPYLPNELHKVEAHLTNEHLSLTGRCNNTQLHCQEWPAYPTFWPVISEHCCQLMKPFLASVRAKQKNEPLKLGFLGIDFMVDVDDKLWLLEINHGPCFPTSETHPLFDVLYSNFWRHVGEEIILPLFQSRNPSVQANFIVL